MFQTVKQICTVKNKKFADKPESMREMIDALCKEGSAVVSQQTINVGNNYRPSQKVILFESSIKARPELSFKITKGEALRITNEIANILRDPQIMAKYLRDLDEELGRKMLEQGIEFSDADLPQYVIAGKGNFIAGPPPEGYVYRTKNYLLDQLLLRNEMAAGINQEGYTPEFYGIIDYDTADSFVAEGHIFSENEQIDNILLHGKYSHRLMFEVIRKASECGDLNLNSSQQQLTHKQLLEMLVLVDYNENNLWAHLLDNTDDTTYFTPALDADEIDYSHNIGALFRPQNYCYSSRSPFVFKSLLTCFGTELELPNLQHYLLDSHWKQVRKITDRALESDKEGKLTERLSPSDLYTNCVKSLFCNSNATSQVVDNPLTPRVYNGFPAKREAFDYYVDEGIMAKSKKKEAVLDSTTTQQSSLAGRLLDLDRKIYDGRENG